MSIFRKGMSLFGQAWDNTFGVKSADLKVPVRFTNLPDPVIHFGQSKPLANEWPFTNRYRALRKRRNKAARIARAVMRANAN